MELNMHRAQLAGARQPKVGFHLDLLVQRHTAFQPAPADLGLHHTAGGSLLAVKPPHEHQLHCPPGVTRAQPHQATPVLPPVAVDHPVRVLVQRRRLAVPATHHLGLCLSRLCVTL
eukprot:CAMPEP_0117688336 /NCGR_PEP_ID=MMETSP0804-20121206/23759_1 /TAXON_ID=1074897 /ORGANISM="Tetraselmis astigmatica, Strain CCMP880" /LENGTH=115 /DNA_ID=CAMNT_0005500749 /DNA_START=207 /DNA_END=551 /DNA_ORIENTATION=-